MRLTKLKHAQAKRYRCQLRRINGHKPKPCSVMRDESCPNFSFCLMFAAQLDWPALTCTSCPVFKNRSEVA